MARLYSAAHSEECQPAVDNLCPFCILARCFAPASCSSWTIHSNNYLKVREIPLILEKFSVFCKYTGYVYWISATTFQIISKVLGESEEEDSSRISDHRSPSMTRPHEAVYRPPSANEGLPLSNSTPRSPRTASRGSIHRNRKYSQIEEIVRMPNFVHSYCLLFSEELTWRGRGKTVRHELARRVAEKV